MNKSLHGQIQIVYVEDENADIGYLYSAKNSTPAEILTNSVYTKQELKSFGVEEVKKWAKEDNQRFRDYYKGLWSMQGVYAKINVCIETSRGFVINTIETPVQNGIPSDSDEEFKFDIEQGLVKFLGEIVNEFGFGEIQYSVKFKQWYNKRLNEVVDSKRRGNYIPMEESKIHSLYN